MKKIFFLLALIFAGNSFAQNGWIGKDYPQGQYPRELLFLNDNTGWLLGQKILKSTNAGTNWIEQISPFTSMSNYRMAFLNVNTGWIFCFENSSNFRENLKILKTTNGGSNWNLISTVQQSYIVQDIYPLTENTFFLATGTVMQGPIGPPAHYGSILKTTNGGTTYTEYKYNSSDHYLFSNINFINQNTGWAIISYDTTFSVELLKSTNAGVSWYSLNLSETMRVTDFQFFNENTGYARGFNDSGGMLLKTYDGGVNWQTLVMHDSINNGISDIYFINSETGWVFGRNLSLAKTTDGGISWKYNRVIPPIYGGTNFGQFINNLTGWFLGHNGSQFKLYQTFNGGVTNVTQTSSEVPGNFSLSQNFPNPFNPSTKINYELPVTNFVSVIVYDVLGNEVETLVNEKQNAGSYSVDFNAASLPSGIYFYKLITEKFSETKKMILVK
jgi:photosystem II stability/assembly factor-like uncharacterized protein